MSVKMLFHPETKDVQLAGCTEDVAVLLTAGYLRKQPGVKEVAYESKPAAIRKKPDEEGKS